MEHAYNLRRTGIRRARSPSHSPSSSDQAGDQKSSHAFPDVAGASGDTDIATSWPLPLSAPRRSPSRCHTESRSPTTQHQTPTLVQGGAGPTMSAGSMLPRRVPFFNTCSRSAVLATHIRKSENLADKTLRPLYILLRFGILMFSVTPTNARSRRS